MLTYDLKVGYKCNNRCKHCVIEDSKDILQKSGIKSDLTTEECFNQIDVELKKGIDKIVITGGEVTIRKDFGKIIEKCNNSNLDITIQTNGRLLNRKNIIDSIKHVENIRFVIALHGSESATHDEITQVEGSFNETCNGIRAMVDNKKLVVLKVVISKINARELHKIVEVAHELGVKYICFAFPHGQGGARKNFDEVIPTYSYIKPHIDKVIEISKYLGINIEFEAIPFCIIPKNMKLVGELKYLRGNAICTQVNEDTFDWHEVRKSIKLKGRNCKECALDSICEGPWSEYIESFGSDELVPIKMSNQHKESLLEAIKKFKNSI